MTVLNTVAISEKEHKSEAPYGRSDNPPWFDQGLATHDGITWSSDSSAVTFEGVNGVRFIAHTR